LRLMDRPAPMAEARARLEHAGRRRRAGRSTAMLRRAAILLLGSTAVLSATVPGSPLRDWLANDRGAAGPTATAVHEPVAAPATAPAAESAEAAPAGISVRPLEGRMRVVLTAPAPGSRIRVRLHDGERVGVWAAGVAARARFRSGPERIEVDGAGPGEIRVEIPRAAREVTLEVDGQVYLRKQGEDLRFPGPAADTAGPEIVFEVRP
ncbi:MAG: hypothetical protein H0X65_12100, partial [Gemmatimonadetes bacterium]|nr:hypothetical protein [Gemmatimonadota bacterium]